MINLSDDEVVSTQTKEGKDYIYLRSYSKIIFFYPLLFFSLVLWIVELINGSSVSWVGIVWMIIFFMNLFVIAFDVSSTTFIGLIMVLVIILILVFIFLIPNLQGVNINISTQILMNTDFYMWMTIILAVTIGMALIKPFIHYWVLESNELINKKRFFGEEKRYPTRYLRVQKALPDIFEYLLLRAGSLSLILRDKEVIHLSTVLNIKHKTKEIERILGELDVQISDQV